MSASSNSGIRSTRTVNLEVGLAAYDLLHWGHVIDLGRKCGFERMIGDSLLARLRNRLLDDFVHDALAEGLLQVRNGGFSRPETLEMHTRPHLGETVGKARIQVIGTDDDAKFAVQAFGNGLRDFHLKLSLRSYRRWCGRRDLNPHDFRHENLNLACLPIPPRPRARALRGTHAPPKRVRISGAFPGC